jgi:glycosidase
VKALGINAIWIMPIYPIGNLNSFGSPYCIKNYEEVNPDLGTMNDLKTLVTEAHNRKIAVMLDWVANHTSWDAEWIVHKSWYTQNASGNIISPPGTTWNDVADLNYSNDTMRQAMIDAMEFWITNADIDGFRCDAADYVPFDFWKQAIDSLHHATDKNLILLAEGSRADHFTAGFQMNFSWDFLSVLKNVFKNNSFLCKIGKSVQTDPQFPL